MVFIRNLPRSALAAVILFAAGVASADMQVKVESITCGDVSTIVTTKKFCYVKDMSSQRQYIELFVAAGINISGSVPLAVSGSIRSLLGIKVRYDIQADESYEQALERAIKVAATEHEQLMAQRNLEPKGYSHLQCTSDGAPTFVDELLAAAAMPENSCEFSRLL